MGVTVLELSKEPSCISVGYRSIDTTPREVVALGLAVHDASQAVVGHRLSLPRGFSIGGGIEYACNMFGGAREAAGYVINRARVDVVDPDDGRKCGVGTAEVFAACGDVGWYMRDELVGGERYITAGRYAVHDVAGYLSEGRDSSLSHGGHMSPDAATAEVFVGLTVRDGVFVKLATGPNAHHLEMPDAVRALDDSQLAQIKTVAGELCSFVGLNQE